MFRITWEYPELQDIVEALRTRIPLCPCVCLPLSDFLRIPMSLIPWYLCLIVHSLPTDFLYFLIASYDSFVPILPSLSKSLPFHISLVNILIQSLNIWIPYS